MYNNIISIENLLLSWREFLKGKRKRKDVAEFSLNFFDNIIQLHQELKSRTYKHGGYQAFRINDPKPRDIHKANVRDRLIHHAIYRILYSYFDKKFIFDSYSCRLEKGTHKAINRSRFYYRKVGRNNTKTCWILKCDIKKFFANIDHQTLKDVLAKHIKDKNVLWLLVQIIDSFNTRERRGVGLPLGNLTSQLFVNIYMNEFDQFVKRNLKIEYYIRYADDFIILCTDKSYLKNIIPIISRFLEENLKLILHPDKIFIKTLFSGVDFLGYITLPYYRVLRTKTKKRMFKRINDKNIQSYLGVLSHCNGYKLKNKLICDIINAYGE